MALTAIRLTCNTVIFTSAAPWELQRQTQTAIFSKLAYENLAEWRCVWIEIGFETDFYIFAVKTKQML